jgi:hypothetical protein
MSTKPDDQSVAIADSAVAQKMFPDRSTDEVVADIVAAEPGKHSTSLAERMRRAQEAASAGNEDAWEGFARARVSEIGGDFDEMMPGNKPRYTVEENGDVKDHDTGTVHKAIQETAPAALEAGEDKGKGVLPAPGAPNVVHRKVARNAPKRKKKGA